VMVKRTAVLSSPVPFEMRRAGERSSIEAVVVDIWARQWENQRSC